MCRWAMYLTLQLAVMVSGVSALPSCMQSVTCPKQKLLLSFSFVSVTEMLTLELKKSTGNETIHGKLIINLSTNVNAPARNGNNTIMPSNATLSPSQPSSSSLSREESNRLSIPSQANAHTMSSAQTASHTSSAEEPLPAGCVNVYWD
jgi:hypothetical protein